MVRSQMHHRSNRFDHFNNQQSLHHRPQSIISLPPLPHPSSEPIPTSIWALLRRV